MSIKAMTWAFALPLEPRAKLALLAIADNARDDGVAWPSRETIAEKSSQSRSTVGRRLKTLVDLGVIGLFERFREDGTQTTDEIRLNLLLSADDVLRKMHDAGPANEADEEVHGSASEADTETEPDKGGGCQPDTPGCHSGHPTVAVVTGGGLQSGHPQDEPSLEPKNPPNPPDGGPLSKPDKEAAARKKLLWESFVQGYPSIGTMDQQAAHDEFASLSLDDAEWAVSVIPVLKAELKKARDRPPKNAHIWLRKQMFRNFARVKINAPPPEGVWIVEGSEQDLALRLARRLARTPSPFVCAGPDGTRGYRRRNEVGRDLLAMLAFADDVPLRWPVVERGTPQFAVWQQRFVSWIGHALPAEPRRLGGETVGPDAIHVPSPWPPSKQGVIYQGDEEPEEPPDFEDPPP